MDNRLPVSVCMRFILGVSVGVWSWILCPVFMGALVLIPGVIGLAVGLLFATSCRVQYGYSFYGASYAIGTSFMILAWFFCQLPINLWLLIPCLTMTVLVPVIAYEIEVMKK